MVLPTDVPDRHRVYADMTEPTQAIRQARRLIQGFTLTDPTLWPILSEIDLVLSRADV